MITTIYIGLGVAITDPPSGSVIAGFEGTRNVITLVCNVTNPALNNEQDIVVWSIANFRGGSGVAGLLKTQLQSFLNLEEIPYLPHLSLILTTD